MSKMKSRIRIVRDQRMKLSMRHRILIGSSIAASLTFIMVVFINFTSSEQVVAGKKSDLNNSMPAIEKTEAIVVKPCYPNPFNGYFHYEFKTTTPIDAELTLINSAGQEIKNIKVKAVPGLNSISVINDCNMKPGIYYAILKSNDKKYVQRLEKD